LTIILVEYGAINVDIFPYISGMVRGQSIFIRIQERRNQLCQEEAISGKVLLINDQDKNVPNVILQEGDDESTALMSEQTDVEDGTILMSEENEDVERTMIMAEPSDGQSAITLPENNPKGEDLNCNAKGQTHVLIGAALPNGFWKCVCGRTNASYVSSCACGINKYDVKLVPEVKGNKENISPVAKQGDWICSCGRLNATYVSSCACGASKRDIIGTSGQTTNNVEKTAVKHNDKQNTPRSDEQKASVDESWRRSEAAHQAWLKSLEKNNL